MGFGLGNSNSDSNGTTPTTTHEESPGHSMKHGKVEVAAENAPTVKMIVTEDDQSGWNIKLETKNFKFTPENVNKKNVDGEGHAHLFIDGKKITRMYGENFYYGGSFDGKKTFKVGLNANDHSEYAIGSKVISDSVKVEHDHTKTDHGAMDKDKMSKDKMKKDSKSDEKTSDNKMDSMQK